MPPKLLPRTPPRKLLRKLPLSRKLPRNFSQNLSQKLPRKCFQSFHGFESFHESTSTNFWVLVPWKQAAASAEGRKLSSDRLFFVAMSGLYRLPTSEHSEVAVIVRTFSSLGIKDNVVVLDPQLARSWPSVRTAASCRILQQIEHNVRLVLKTHSRVPNFTAFVRHL